MKRILITYSTWAGATQEVAEKIAQILSSKSYRVDVIDSKQHIEIEDFDVVVLGTSIHAGKTGRSFRKFIKKNINLLNQKTTAIFIVCANMMVDSKENRSETLAWLDQAIGIYENFKPKSIGLFGGATLTSGDKFKNLNFIIKKIIKAMDKKMIQEFGTSDFREWKSIHKWTEDLINKIEQD